KLAMKKGKRAGSTRYGRGALHNLLRNEVYIGRIVHRGTSYPGLHPPIVDQELWDKVQGQIAANRSGSHPGPLAGYESPLQGLIFDDRGNVMSPSFTAKRGVQYRYYVSQAVLQNGKDRAGKIARLPARPVEAAVAEAVKQHTDHHGSASNWSWRRSV